MTTTFAIIGIGASLVGMAIVSVIAYSFFKSILVTVK